MQAFKYSSIRQSSFKCLVGYKIHADEITLLLIRFSKLNGYLKSFEDTK